MLYDCLYAELTSTQAYLLHSAHLLAPGFYYVVFYIDFQDII